MLDPNFTYRVYNPEKNDYIFILDVYPLTLVSDKWIIEPPKEDTNTIEMRTDYKDINDNYIYEGDIIQVVDEKTKVETLDTITMKDGELSLDKTLTSINDLKLEVKGDIRDTLLMQELVEAELIDVKP